MIILSAVFELVRLVVLALLARSILIDTHHAVSLFLLRILIVGNFVFPTLLFLAWFNYEFVHYMYIFIPLKIALLLTELVSIPSLFSNIVQQLLNGGFLAIFVGIVAVIVIDGFILFAAFKIVQSLKKPQAEPPAIETVELS